MSIKKPLWQTSGQTYTPTVQSIIVYFGRVHSEPYISTIKTYFRVGQQYPGVFRDTTKGLRIPSVSRLSLLLGAGSGTDTGIPYCS